RATTASGTHESKKNPLTRERNTATSTAKAADRSPVTRKSRRHLGQTVYTSEAFLKVVLCSGSGTAGMVVLASSSETSLRQFGQQMSVRNMPNTRVKPRRVVKRSTWQAVPAMWFA